MIQSTFNFSRGARLLRAFAPACTALALLGIAPLSHAGPYGSVSLGESVNKLDCYGSACDRKNMSGKVLFGYRFGNNVAIEGSYFQAGRLSAEEQTSTYWYSDKVKAQAIGVGAAYFMPFSESWMGVVRGGVAAVKAKATYLNGTSSGTSSFEENKTSANPYLGIGISYMITPQFSVDATYDWNQMKVGGDNANVHAVRVGLSFWL